MRIGRSEGRISVSIRIVDGRADPTLRVREPSRGEVEVSFRTGRGALIASFPSLDIGPAFLECTGDHIVTVTGGPADGSGHDGIESALLIVPVNRAIGAHGRNDN